jgi:hypothetical protein
MDLAGIGCSSVNCIDLMLGQACVLVIERWGSVRTSSQQVSAAESLLAIPLSAMLRFGQPPAHSVEARVQLHAIPCGICGGRSVTGTGSTPGSA